MPTPANLSPSDFHLDQKALKEFVDATQPPPSPLVCPTCNRPVDTIASSSWGGARYFTALPCGHKWGTNPGGKTWKGKGR